MLDPLNSFFFHLFSCFDRNIHIIIKQNTFNRLGGRIGVQYMYENNEKMTPKQTADFLGIGSEVLKKYSLLLEHNGHNIERNAMNHRYYTGEDIALIKAMILLNREKSVTLESAASIVTSTDTNINAILKHNETHTDTNNPVQTVMPLQILKELQLVLDNLQQQRKDEQALRDEIRERDKSMIELQTEIKNKLDQQTELINEQNTKIIQLQEEVKSKQQTSFWKRLFNIN